METKSFGTIAAPDTGFTLDWDAYTSPAVLSAEYARIFRNTWQYVGPSAKLAKPGDHIVANLGDIPIVITRDKEGDLNGLVNVCRHRMHPVALADGSKPLLQCIYHGWTYTLGGALQSAPRCNDELEIDRASHGLLRIAVTQLGPWIFANADPEAAPLEGNFADCRPTLDAMLEDSTRFVFKERWTYEMEANWKLFVENSIECYHCELIHGDSFNVAFDLSRDGFENTIYDNVVCQYIPSKYLPSSMDRDGDNGFQFIFLPPTTLIAVDAINMLVLQVIPTGPETCTMIADVHVDPTVPQEAQDEWGVMYGKTLDEDQGAVERQQKGVRSGTVQRGRLLDHSEAALRWFESWVVARLNKETEPES